MPSFISYINLLLFLFYRTNPGYLNGSQRYVIHYKSQRKLLTFFLSSVFREKCLPVCPGFSARGLRLLVLKYYFRTKNKNSVWRLQQ